MREARWLVCVMIGLLAGACGDDGGDGGGGGAGNGGGSGSVTLGVDSSTQLSSLDGAQAEAACQSFVSSFDSAIGDSGNRAVCVAGAVAEQALSATGADFELDVAQCNTYVDTCLAEGGIEEDTTVAADCTAGLSQCDLTAGEVEACAQAGVNALDGLLAQLTCENLADLDKLGMALQDFQTIGQASACQPLSDCPELNVFAAGD